MLGANAYVFIFVPGMPEGTRHFFLSFIIPVYLCCLVPEVPCSCVACYLESFVSVLLVNCSSLFLCCLLTVILCLCCMLPEPKLVVAAIIHDERVDFVAKKKL